MELIDLPLTTKLVAKRLKERAERIEAALRADYGMEITDRDARDLADLAQCVALLAELVRNLWEAAAR